MSLVHDCELLGGLCETEGEAVARCGNNASLIETETVGLAMY